jgi:hypothetical protein
MPETMTTAGQAGLFCIPKGRAEALPPQIPVPLTGVSVSADIVGLCARVTVTQRYENRERSPIEAVYLFPLDEGAAVCGFDALIDGTLVESRAMEREEAFAKYDDALQAGHGAYLLDEERPDVFQASIGNLPPGKTAIVKLTYVRELDVQNGLLQFVVPTTVAPRYAPPGDHIGLGRPDADTLNPPRDWDVPYGLELLVTLSLESAITRVESPSHPIAVSTADGKTIVTLGAAHTALDRDFVLAVSADALNVPRAWIEREADGTAAIAVGFVPQLDAASVPVEVIFVIDESGSMQGDSIAEVRNALELCLRSMTPGCRFNIVGFGSDFGRLFPESRPYDDESLKMASAYVQQLSADRGGTNILPALQSVLGQPSASGLRRQAVVMTDGEVSNTDEVIALAKANAATTRVFTFGIGAGPSRHLVQGLARAGRGTAEFIAPGERIEAKVLRLFGRLLAPAIDEVTMEWGGLDAVQSPSVLPPVMHGMRLLAYGFVKDVKPTTLTLTGKGDRGAVRFEIPIDPAGAVDGRTVGTLAARARIRELEESPEWTDARRSRQGRARGGGQATREIVDLAMRYNLVSRETSLVAIEKRDTPVVGDLQLRRVPVALTAGWDETSRRVVAPSIRLGSAAARLASLGGLPPPMARGSRSVESASEDITVERLMSSADSIGSTGFLRRQLDRLGSAFGSRREDDELRARVLALASLQRADGSWRLEPALANLLERELRELENAVPAAPTNRLARDAWATALAVAWLERHAATLEHEWRLLADKARRWLDAHVQGSDIGAAATQFLG